VLAIVAFSVVPIGYEWLKHRRKEPEERQRA
jgi:hypothetical protein